MSFLSSGISVLTLTLGAHHLLVISIALSISNVFQWVWREENLEDGMVSLFLKSN